MKDITRLQQERDDYFDTVAAMVAAATGTDDVDEQERLLHAAGPKPSHYVAAMRERINKLERIGREILAGSLAHDPGCGWFYGDASRCTCRPGALLAELQSIINNK